MTATATKLRLIAIADNTVEHDWLAEAALRLRTAAPHCIDTLIDEIAHVARIAANTGDRRAQDYANLSVGLLALDTDADHQSVRAAALEILRATRRAVNEAP